MQLFQKYHFLNQLSALFYLSFFAQKICSKVDPSKNTFSKLLSQRIHFQNYFLKNYIFKNKFLSLKKKKKKKKIQKMHFQSCFLTKYEKYIFKNIFSECINFIVLIYSSSESLGKLSKPLIICLTTFFLMYLHSFKNTFRYCKCMIQADYS